jgi:hypothetical protein
MCGNLYICDAVFQSGKDTIESRSICKIADNLQNIARIMTNSQEKTITIDERIEQAREAAHQAGETFGKTSPEFAVAMETLEELHQEAGHQRSAKPQNSLERFCDDNPDAQECLLYDT